MVVRADTTSKEETQPVTAKLAVACFMCLMHVGQKKFWILHRIAKEHLGECIRLYHIMEYDMITQYNVI